MMTTFVQSGRPDLHVVGETHPERWEALRAASATDPVAALATWLWADVEAYVDRIVRRICGTVDSYQDAAVVERDDLWDSIYRNAERKMLALGEQRPLTEDDLAWPRELGRRRAQQGLALDDLLRAYRVGFTVLSERLSELVDEHGLPYAHALLDRAAHVWMMFDQVTSAVADSYHEALDSQRQDRHRRSLALLGGLQRYPDDLRATEQAARSLGFDPDGSFAVAVLGAAPRCPAPERDVLFIDQPDRLVAIANLNGDPSRAEATFAGRLGQRGFQHVGVGILRQGLAGAHQSLADAQWAHRLSKSMDTKAILYRESWLACMGLRHCDQLDQLVEPVVEVLEQDDEFAETFEAFLEADGNLTGAGKALFVHPNTVGYRLRRLESKTGIDARSPSGMALMQVALIHARLSRSPVAV